MVCFAVFAFNGIGIARYVGFFSNDSNFMYSRPDFYGSARLFNCVVQTGIDIQEIMLNDLQEKTKEYESEKADKIDEVIKQYRASEDDWYEYQFTDHTYSLTSEDKDLSDAQLKKKLGSQYDAAVDDTLGNIRRSLRTSKESLDKVENIVYYASKGDTVITNSKDPEKDFKDIKSRGLYYIKENGKSENNVTYNDGTYFSIEEYDTFKLYVRDATQISGNDDVALYYEAYCKLCDVNTETLAVALVSLALAIIFLVFLLVLCGHKPGKDTPELSFTDKLPGEIHLFLSGGLSVAAVALFAALSFDSNPSADNIKTVFSYRFTFAACAIAVFVWLLFTEWITSVARSVKCKAYFKNFLIVRFISFIVKAIRKAAARIAYKPKRLIKRYFVYLMVFFAFNAFMLIIGVCGGQSDSAVAVAVLIIAALVDAFVMFKCLGWFISLDKIITAASEHRDAEVDDESLPLSLRTLNDSLTVSNQEVRKAVDEAVKNERTKAELITNVSHDLKTPLTSVISYIELLRECDIKNADAEEYIKVIGEKSDNLKVLIENLIEVSKVTTGNVELNNTQLNLKELAIQANVEFQTEFEKNNLNVIFDESCAAVEIYADSRQTYRIFENLLSNAAKYAMPSTRVYTSVRAQGDYGVFEIKNMSAQPLNISPDELTERFVRGDASRGEAEGNGLGLSIAKSICNLQGGKLSVTIDGDLFKAEVFLPLYKA